jgi:hypothetical protein
VEPPTNPPTSEVETEHRGRGFGWWSIALLIWFDAGLGYFAYTENPPVVVFHGEDKWLFWTMTAITLSILLDKLLGE